MRAARFHEIGEPDVLRIEEVAMPEPGPYQVRVAVRAAGVNPADWKKRRGMFGDPPPQTVGAEGSGTIDILGTGVTRFQPGDEVFGLLEGATAEYALADPEGLAKLPTGLSFEDAAGVAVGALTAFQALFDVAHLQQGERVLIHAAAGGVGSFAVQLAHSAGAHVIGTASAENAPFLRELGADEAVDYRTEPFEDQIEPVDVVLDTIGGDTTERSLKVLKPGGRLVSLVRPPENGRWTFHSMSPQPGQLDRIASLLTRGELRAITQKTFALEEIVEAHRESERGRTRGKLIVKVAPE
ncbi:NADP-dependent oxidoreductase [bacterium]|nr:MAG: NADP-dependent oxidoreductase [bacterium]